MLSYLIRCTPCKHSECWSSRSHPFLSFWIVRKKCVLLRCSAFQRFIMTILYCVICRRDTVLAKYAARVGNFSEISDLVIARIPPEDGKMTYRWGSRDLIIANIPEEDVKNAYVYSWARHFSGYWKRRARTLVSDPVITSKAKEETFQISEIF
jgi:hypothetical protein